MSNVTKREFFEMLERTPNPLLSMDQTGDAWITESSFNVRLLDRIDKYHAKSVYPTLHRHIAGYMGSRLNERTKRAKILQRATYDKYLRWLGEFLYSKIV